MEYLISFFESFGLPLAILLVVLFLGVWLVKLLTMAPKGGGAGKVAERPMSKDEVDALAAELEVSIGGGKPTLSDQEKITRLAQSDPERAKDLVRHWLRE